MSNPNNCRAWRRRQAHGAMAMSRRVVLAARRRHPMALRGLELVMGVLFLYLGGAKLLGTPAAVRLFAHIGWGQWFRYVTGVVEVSGALLLLIPALAGASALLLMSVMVAATGIELFVLHRPPAAAMACLCAHTVIAGGRRAQTRRLFARRRINLLACYRSNRRAPTSGPR